MGEVNLGHVRVISQSTSRISRGAGNASTRSRTFTQTSSLEELQDISGFGLWQPKNVPSNLRLGQSQQILSRSAEGPSIIGTLLKYKENSSRWMVIEQSRLPETREGKRQILLIPDEIMSDHNARENRKNGLFHIRQLDIIYSKLNKRAIKGRDVCLEERNLPISSCLGLSSVRLWQYRSWRKAACPTLRRVKPKTCHLRRVNLIRDLPHHDSYRWRR